MQLVMSSDDGRISRRSWTNFVFVTLTLAISSLAMACSGSTNPSSTTGGGEGGAANSSSSSGDMGGSGGGTGGAGGGEPDVPGPVENVLTFDKNMGELPEGIAIDGTTAYIAFGSTFVIKVDLATGKRSDFGQIPAPIGVGMPQGVAIDAQKNVYVAVASADPVQFQPGIYKFASTGGTPTLFAQDVNMSYPRHIYIATTGDFLISSPLGSRIAAFDKTGKHLGDQTIGQLGAGDQSSACAWGESIPMGVTSCVFEGTTLLATNADKSTVFSLEFDPNTGAVTNSGEIAGPDCATLGGAESMVVDKDDPGTTPINTIMLVAARRSNKITRVQYTGGSNVIADGTNLYEPSSMAITKMGTSRYLYIVNSARTTFGSGGIPGLVRMRLGTAK